MIALQHVADQRQEKEKALRQEKEALEGELVMMKTAKAGARNAMEREDAHGEERRLKDEVRSLKAVLVKRDLDLEKTLGALGEMGDVARSQAARIRMLQSREVGAVEDQLEGTRHT